MPRSPPDVALGFETLADDVLVDHRHGGCRVAEPAHQVGPGAGLGGKDGAGVAQVMELRLTERDGCNVPKSEAPRRWLRAQ